MRDLPSFKLKQERLQWIEAGSSAPKQVKSERSAKKIMASIFWDAKGVLLIDYLEKGTTITHLNIIATFWKLDKKYPVYRKDNRVHTSFLTMVKLNELKYNTDLAPSD